MVKQVEALAERRQSVRIEQMIADIQDRIDRKNGNLIEAKPVELGLSAPRRGRPGMHSRCVLLDSDGASRMQTPPRGERFCKRQKSILSSPKKIEESNFEKGLARLNGTRCSGWRRGHWDVRNCSLQNKRLRSRGRKIMKISKQSRSRIQDTNCMG